MELEKIREGIDRVDSELIALFKERMALCAEVCRKSSGLVPVSCRKRRRKLVGLM